MCLVCKLLGSARVSVCMRSRECVHAFACVCVHAFARVFAVGDVLVCVCLFLDCRTCSKVVSWMRHHLSSCNKDKNMCRYYEKCQGVKVGHHHILTQALTKLFL